MALLSVEELDVRVRTEGGEFPAVDRVSLAIGAEETVALVGESGCGKSMLALSVMRLEPRPAARIAGGAIRLGDADLARLPEPALRRLRGKAVSMVFQEPMTSLNPVLTIGRQVSEVVRRHEGLGRHDALDRAREMLDLVRLPDAAARLGEYPHRLSGGMRQRVVIAMALACRPKLLLADEPTTALDVTIQAEILALIRDLQQRMGMALLLITHDLGLVAETADRVAVMYAGRKVEEAATRELFANPQHPYTVGLMRSIPRAPGAGGRRGRLIEIPGTVPPIAAPRIGCLFAPRCFLATGRCRAEAPPLEPKAPGHSAACWESARLGELAA